MKTYIRVLIVFILPLICLLSQFATAQTPPLEPCSLIDMDMDDDGLIEICDIEGLDAIRDNLDINGNLDNVGGCRGGCIGYELIRDLDFADFFTGYRAFEYITNWEPIPIFNAVFAANGYTIYNLEINRPDIDVVGLFGEIGDQAKIKGVRLSDADIIGRDYVGSLAGSNGGEISDSYVVIRNENYKVKGDEYVGGLVGENGGLITDSYTIVNVQGEDYVGGLAGDNFATIRNSRTTSTIVAHFDSGGLVGINSGIIGGEGGIIVGSYANSNVSGLIVGGLTSDNSGSIQNSRATGMVTGRSSAGGLVGYNYGVIVNSYADTNIIGGADVAGGLVGVNIGGHIGNSYALGNLTLTADGSSIGGLVGRNSGGAILNTYAAGNLFGTLNVGGLVGHHTTDGSVATIRNSYAIGSVEGDSDGNVGSLVGLVSGGSIESSYARDEFRLIGSNRDSSKHIITSFTSSMSKLRLSTTPSTTPAEVYYLWSISDWDFGSEAQYPILKYTVGTDTDMPACGVSELPSCDAPLNGQRAVRQMISNQPVYINIKVFLEGVLR